MIMKTTKNQLLFMCLLGMGYATTNAQDYNDYQEAMKRAESAAKKSTTVVSPRVSERATDGKSHRLSGDLLKMAGNVGLQQKLNGQTSLLDEYKQKYTIRENKIIVEIIALSAADATEIKKTLEADKTISNVVSFDTHVSCLIPMVKLAELDKNAKIRFVYGAYKPVSNSGKVNGQGDKALKSDVARENFKVTGKDVKVGILSDSYNNLFGAANGVQDGELPGLGNPDGYTKPVVVLKDLAFGGADEGRAMAEIVHDVAPAAELYFYTAFESETDFANGIVKLTDAGCNVIVDDVNYFSEPFFQDGIIAKAVQYAASKGVHYFTSAGNQAINSSYEFKFNPIQVNDPNTTATTFHKFSNNPAPKFPNYYLPFFSSPGNNMTITLQWDEPYVSVSGGTGAKTELDLFVYNSNFELVAAGFANNVGGDPLEIINQVSTQTSGFLFIRIEKRSGPNPGKIKLAMNSSSILIPAVPAFKDVYKFIPGVFASTIVAHANAKEAFTVGAADYRKTVPFGAATDIIENFSSIGGTNILFDRNGRRINERRMKPDFVAPDAANNSFFGSDSDGDGLPNFSGTSAAAPYAAAVAALSIEARSCTPVTISPFEMKATFQFNTRDMDDPATPNFDYGFDNRTGYGFIDAEEIVGSFDFCSDFISYDFKQPETVALRSFPNPVVDHLNLSFGDDNSKVNLQGVTIAISDFNGLEVIAPKSIVADGNNISLDVNKLPKGMYFATISNNTGFNKTIKFIK
jgi:Secretion system C-terminal sorting domain/Subtilase family